MSKLGCFGVIFAIVVSGILVKLAFKLFQNFKILTIIFNYLETSAIMRRFRLKLIKSTPTKQEKNLARNKIKLGKRVKAPNFIRKFRAVIWSIILISPLLISIISTPVEGLQSQIGAAKFKQPTKVSANLCSRVHERARCGTGDISAFLEKQCCRLVVFGA